MHPAQRSVEKNKIRGRNIRNPSGNVLRDQSMNKSITDMEPNSIHSLVELSECINMPTRTPEHKNAGVGISRKSAFALCASYFFSFPTENVFDTCGTEHRPMKYENNNTHATISHGIMVILCPLTTHAGHLEFMEISARPGELRGDGQKKLFELASKKLLSGVPFPAGGKVNFLMMMSWGKRKQFLSSNLAKYVGVFFLSCR